MSDVAISVEGIGKKYRIGTPTGTDRLSETLVNLGRATVSAPGRWARRLRGGAGPAATAGRGEFWALKDVSFEVKRGEVVGVIGRNGAGKSTLLKVLSRITDPTTGRFGVRGRVGSLLEVGTGFHGELTGRENVFLSGSVLGMGRREIQKKFDEIVAFAEVDKFLDTPVKRYSSGMLMRLGFAVAAHLEPEILIVDEVLAVGDAAFQKKCLGKMQDAGRGGRTVLFVSHNMTAVHELCGRAVWLAAGRKEADGPARAVISHYVDAGGATASRWEPGGDSLCGNGVRLCSAAVVPCGDANSSVITVRTPVRLDLEFRTTHESAVLNFSVVLDELERGCVFNTVSDPVRCPNGVIRGSVLVPGDLLNDGTYTVRVLLVKDTSVVLFDQSNVLGFQVDDAGRAGNWRGRWAGAVRPALPWIVTTEVEEGDRVTT